MSEKKDYEIAVDAFLEAEKAWQDAEEIITSGIFLFELGKMAQWDNEKALASWKFLWDDLRAKQEDYNAKRKSAADALRQAVVLAPTQWRGPDGKSTGVEYKGFTVTSVTKRGFDADSLFKLVRNHGLEDRLMGLKALNKDGVSVPLVKQAWDINYDGVLNWLRANKLDDVVTGAYDEKESTPQVRGPKEVHFLGDKKVRD